MIWEDARLVRWGMVKGGLEFNCWIYRIDSPDLKREWKEKGLNEWTGEMRAVGSQEINSGDLIASETGRRPKLQLLKL